MQKRYAYTKISIGIDLIQNVALDSGSGFIQVHISFFYWRSRRPLQIVSIEKVICNVGNCNLRQDASIVALGEEADAV
jgi:hypothetical protein